ncbi:MAG: rhodanese-like domain-containing protein, partial [Deltaproteobacteria bacterium]
QPELVSEITRLTALDLAAELASPQPPVVLDVRAPQEWKKQRLACSRNVPLNRLREGLAEVPRGQNVVVHCAGGYRSAIAASLLRQAGFDRVEDLVGGIGAWQAAQLPVVNS